MIDDFGNNAEQGTIFHADICIVGAGAAGITLARALRGRGLEVILLESGGADYDPAVQDMAAGSGDDGVPYYDPREARLRFFGGTCAIWGGRVAQLDAIDFDRRDWVPHSGWPFAKDELRPWYALAQAALDLPAMNDNMPGDFHCPLDETLLRPAFWQFDTRFDRFTLRNAGDLMRDTRLRILLNATLTALVPTESGAAIEKAVIANLKGGRGHITAKIFVLATGGLEVPRLLLASRHPAHPRGVGNNQDLVGRFFMEHPHGRGARIHANDPAALFRALPRFMMKDRQRLGLLLRPGEIFQKHEAILNTGFTLAVRRHEGEKQIAYKQLYNAMRHELSPTRAGRLLWQISRRAATAVQDRLGVHLSARKLNKPGYGLYAVLRAEQAPNPDSRVRLDESSRDALGVPRLRLDWRLSDLDRRSAAGAMEALDRALRKAGLGWAAPAAWLSESAKEWMFDPLVSNHAIGGYHHMGTARMADNPRHGVTDAHGRVHGVENLYVAGSALFPTGGWANPTLTIIALAMRLGDRLRKD